MKLVVDAPDARSAGGTIRIETTLSSIVSKEK